MSEGRTLADLAIECTGLSETDTHRRSAGRGAPGMPCENGARRHARAWRGARRAAARARASRTRRRSFRAPSCRHRDLVSALSSLRRRRCRHRCRRSTGAPGALTLAAARAALLLLTRALCALSPGWRQPTLSGSVRDSLNAGPRHALTRLRSGWLFCHPPHWRSRVWKPAEPGA
jgi:hypothetical protein